MKSAVVFRIRGLDQMQRRLSLFSAKYRAQIASALQAEATAVLEASKDYVPIDDRDLIESGYVSDATYLGGATDPTVIGALFGREVASVQVGYAPPGSKAAAYAVAVHEHPSPASPPSWRNVRDKVTGRFRAVRFSRGGPKFLEIPLRAAASGMEERLGLRLKF